MLIPKANETQQCHEKEVIVEETRRTKQGVRHRRWIIAQQWQKRKKPLQRETTTTNYITITYSKDHFKGTNTKDKWSRYKEDNHWRPYHKSIIEETQRTRARGQYWRRLKPNNDKDKWSCIKKISTEDLEGERSPQLKMTQPLRTKSSCPHWKRKEAINTKDKRSNIRRKPTNHQILDHGIDVEHGLNTTTDPWEIQNIG